MSDETNALLILVASMLGGLGVYLLALGGDTMAAGITAGLCMLAAYWAGGR